MKNEINKYLDFFFQDFPETEEVMTEKTRILKHMEEVHKKELTDGESKLDAMEAALDAVGDIRELHRRFGKKKTRSYKL
jgi:vacuolar-type H+-ATPase subunit I/STV1